MNFIYVFTILFQLIIALVQNSLHQEIDGKYSLVGNKDQILTIENSMLTLANLNDSSKIYAPKYFKDSTGKFIEAPNCSVVNYSIDSIDANGGIYISAHKESFRCYSYHIIRDNNFLSLTPLKTLKGIEFHFTSPELYVLNNTREDETKDEVLSILLDKNIQLNKINYVAFDQPAKLLDKVSIGQKLKIKLDSTGLNKSTIVINPIMYAKKNYVAYFVDENENILIEIPIIYNETIDEIKNRFTREQQKIELQKIKVTDLYLIANRFNPSRERTVNKVFNENIIGQVQTFELRSLKEDYR